MIPKLYSEKLIKSELINNIKNHSPKDRDFLVEINIYKPDDSTIILKIKNPERNDDDYESSFEGIKCLKLLSDSKLFYFTYDYKIVSRIFIQELIFKVN